MSAETKPVQIDVRELFNLLDSTEQHVIEDIKKLIQENLSAIRESWLVHSLVDYYYISHSKNVIDLLAQLREPHCKHLLEKLYEGMKSDHQLYALQLLLHIVCKQPSWLPNIVSTHIFKAVIKCLKTEIDIPILMTAVTIVTIILPSVPTTIGPSLPDIFEIFNRLASFNVKKPAGNIPDVFLLHLQVAVYALFHRLYGMFPYNFLTYLRHFYTKKDNIPIFEEVVKSMVERVRLHPHLVTANKETETSVSRWRQMETQDVIVECARMSLDLVEGTWEELHCPVIAKRYSISRLPTTRHQLQQTHHDKTKPEHGQFVPLQSPGLEPLTFWSPSEILGLSTPPPSQRTTPATSLLDASSSSAQSHTVLTPLITPPVNTPRETPPITEDTDRSVIHSISRTTAPPKSSDPKRLSADSSIFSSHSIASSQMTYLMPTSQSELRMASVPPSPLKAEFTSTPPTGIVKTFPVLQASRALRFDQDGKEEPSSEESCTKVDNQSLEAGATQEAETEPVSMDTLPHVIEGLKSDDGEDDSNDDDDEVSEITTKLQSGSSQTMITAESVARFMKSVNRIRFNSYTASNSVENVIPQSKSKSAIRSRSCPQLPKLLPSREEEEEQPSRSASTTCHESASDSPVCDNVTSKNNEKETQIQSTGSVMSDSAFSSTSTDTVKSKQEVEVSITATSSTNGLDLTKCPVFHDAQKPESVTDNTDNEFVSLLKQIWNPVTVSMCQKCNSQSLSAAEQVHSQEMADMGLSLPFFTKYSPPELLDRHLQLGETTHTKELSKLPIPSRQNVNWTHFGGVPPVDEVNILRGQNLLLHNQLMYERHKREQHAKRNRRLLRKIANAKTVEEQNNAMADQIQLHENTIRDLNVSLKLLQDENHKLREAKDSDEYQKLVQLRTCLQENADLTAAKKEFNTLLIRQREEMDSLSKKLQETRTKLFSTEKELEFMREQAVISQKLKEQVLKLHQELLLMGELQQKCQDKLQTVRACTARPEQESLISALKKNLQDARKSLESKSSLIETNQSRITDLEEACKVKDISLTELKKKLEHVKTSHDEELQAVEDKYESLIRVNQQLEAQILHLYSEIEELKCKPIKAVPIKRSNQTHVPGGASVADFEPQSRERTHSDVAHRPLLKGPLSRTDSAPVSHMPHSSDITGSSQAQHRTHEFTDITISGDSLPRFSERSVDILNSGESSPFQQSERVVERTETGSMSSRDSSVVTYPTRGSLLYTDSEDNRSVSAKSNTLSDSGYMG